MCSKISIRVSDGRSYGGQECAVRTSGHGRRPVATAVRMVRTSVGIGAAGAVGLTGCSTNGGSSGNIISMGILIGVTGELSEVGPAIWDAVELAVKQVRDADNGFSVDT